MQNVEKIKIATVYRERVGWIASGRSGDYERDLCKNVVVKVHFYKEKRFVVRKISR